MSHPIVVFLLLILSSGEVLGQRHRDGCLNSNFHLADNFDKSNDLGECFGVRVRITSVPNTFHLSVIWIRNNPLCRNIKVRLVEILGRGSARVTGAYRFPMGSMSKELVKFCPDTNTASYSTRFHTFPSIYLESRTQACYPQVVNDPQYPKLYEVGTYRNRTVTNCRIQLQSLLTG